MDPLYIGTTSYGSHWLDRPAAESWQRMVRDGCPPTGITDAGRTDAEQTAVFLRYFTTDYAASARFDRRVWLGRTYWRAYQPGGRLPWPSAATPGSVQARHTYGRALDLNGPTKVWARANGPRYGWIPDLVKGEDWHLEYQPWRDVVAADNPIGGGGGSLPDVPNLPTPTPPTPIPEEDIMASLEDLQRVIGAAVDPLRAEFRAEYAQPEVHLFRIAGTAGVWIDLGGARRAMTGEQHAAYGHPPFTDLAAADPFWDLPIAGIPGELVGQTGDSSGAAWLRVTYGRQWIDGPTFASWRRPPIFTLPGDDPFWLLPTVGATPDTQEA